MQPIRVVSQVAICSLGFDCPEIIVDIDARPSCSLSDWLQRRGRAARAYPAIQGDRSNQTVFLAGLRAVLKAKETPVGVAPCGFGKSYVAALMAQGAERKQRALGFLTPRRILVKDISSRLTAFAVPHSVLMPGYTPNSHRTVVASIDTVVARNLTLDVDCLVVDEGHMFMSEARLAVLKRHSHIPRVILTATPHRTNGQGIGRIGDTLVLGPTPDELIAAGFLVPARVFAPEVPDVSKCDVNGEDFNESQVAQVMMKPGLTGNIVKEYLFRGRDLPCIVHACNVEHSKSIVKRFNEAGVSAVHIDADTPDAEREAAFSALKLLARPKTHSILIDMAGNTLRFGFPEDEREWTLADTDPSNAKPHAAALAIRRCPKCWYCFKASVDKCPGCGNKHVPDQRTIIERAALLVEKKRATKEAAKEKFSKTATKEQLVQKYRVFHRIGLQRGHKEFWARMMYKNATGHFPTKEIMDAV